MFEDSSLRVGEIQLETHWPTFLFSSYSHLCVMWVKHCCQLQGATLIDTEPHLLAGFSGGPPRASMNTKSWFCWCWKPSPGRSLTTLITEPVPASLKTLMSLLGQTPWIWIVKIETNWSSNGTDLCPGHWPRGSGSKWFFTQPLRISIKSKPWTSFNSDYHLGNWL